MQNEARVPRFWLGKMDTVQRLRLLFRVYTTAAITISFDNTNR
jgi:hypothetical protein